MFLDLWYSDILFCNWVSTIPAVHFYVGDQIVCWWLNSTTKSVWSLWIAIHVAVSLLQSHTAPVGMILMPPNAIMASFPASKSNPSGLSCTMKILNLTELLLSGQILTVPTSQHSHILPPKSPHLCISWSMTSIALH